MADPKDLSKQNGTQPAPAYRAEQPDTSDSVPARVSTAISSGKPLDEAGGAGDHGDASAAQSQEKTAAASQDQRDKS